MKALAFGAGFLCALSAAAADPAIDASIHGSHAHTGDGSRWQRSTGDFGNSVHEHYVPASGSAPRHLQAWRTRGGMGTRSFSGGYTPSYSSEGTVMSGATYTARTVPYSGTFSGSTGFTHRATPTYSGSSATAFSSGGNTVGTPMYSSGSSGTTYTGSGVSRPVYGGFSGGSPVGGSTTFGGSSGTTYVGSSGTSVSGTTYTGSSSPYGSTMATRTVGMAGSSGTVGGRTTIGSGYSAGRPTYSTGGTAGSTFSGAPTITGGSGSGVPYFNSSNSAGSSTGTPTYTGSTSGMSSGTGTYTGRASGVPSGTGAYTGGASGVPSGTRTYTGGASGMPSGTGTYTGGASGVPSGTGTYTGGASGMPSGTRTYTGGASGMPSGTGAYTGGASGMPSGTGAYTGGASSMPSGTGAYTGRISGTPSGTASTAPAGARTGASQQASNTPAPRTTPGGQSDSAREGDTSEDSGPFRDPNRGRGSSSFRSQGGGEQTSPLQGSADNTTYYLREADGSLTPIEPPPYDQMKPDSYYTDLYLTDQPIRFENQTTKEEQFKTELEKAHESNLESESSQPTQGVMSLPLAEEKKGLV